MAIASRTAAAPRARPRASRASLATTSCRFHAARFVPAALSLAIVGDVGRATQSRARRRSSTGGRGVPRRSRTCRRRRPAPRGRESFIDLPGKSQSDIAYGFTTISRLDPRYDAYWMMNNILGQFGLGGRLADNIRERQGMAYYAFSAFDPSLGAGPLIIRAGVDPANVERAIAAIDHEVGTLGSDGPDGRRAGADASSSSSARFRACSRPTRHRDLPADVGAVRARSRLRSTAAGAPGGHARRGCEPRPRRSSIPSALPSRSPDQA